MTVLGRNVAAEAALLARSYSSCATFSSVLNNQSSSDRMAEHVLDTGSSAEETPLKTGGPKLVKSESGGVKIVGRCGLSMSAVAMYCRLNQESMKRYAVMTSHGNGKPSGIFCGGSGAMNLRRSSSAIDRKSTRL